MKLPIPYYAHEFSSELLTKLISDRHPDVVISDVSVVEGKQYGDGNASTAGRCVFDVTYSSHADLIMPKRLVVKIARVGANQVHHVLYRNELDFYQRLRPSLTIETPRCFGGHFDEDSGTFALVMAFTGLSREHALHWRTPAGRSPPVRDRVQSPSCCGTRPDRDRSTRAASRHPVQSLHSSRSGTSR